MEGKNSFEVPNIYPNLDATPLNDRQLRLNKICELRDYLIVEIKEKKINVQRT